MVLPRRVPLALWGIVALFVAATIAVTASLVERGERDALTESEGKAQRFVSGAEAALNRTLLGVDVLLAGIDSLLRPAQRPDGSIDGPHANRLLLELTGRNLLVRDVAVLAED